MGAPQTRRTFVGTAGLAGLSVLARAPPALAEEERLETVSLRLTKSPALCLAPQYVADELLRGEDFADIRYVDTASATESADTIGNGKADLSFDFAAAFVAAIDSGKPVTVLSGAMVGCLDLFAKQSVQSVAALKGRSVGLRALGTSPHLVISLLVAHVGLDPAKDIEWVVNPDAKPIELFKSGKVDVFIGNPPETYELREQRIGHVVVQTAIDRPWSQYFCCMLAGNRDYVRTNPVATKRALRALLKATDLCATEPERIARQIVQTGGMPRYDFALQTLTENGYDKWRQFEAEDTVRFYALKLHEAGMIKAGPQQILAKGTDWRFLNELKRELKA